MILFSELIHGIYHNTSNRRSRNEGGRGLQAEDKLAGSLSVVATGMKSKDGGLSTQQQAGMSELMPPPTSVEDVSSDHINFGCYPIIPILLTGVRSIKRILVKRVLVTRDRLFGQSLHPNSCPYQFDREHWYKVLLQFPFESP